MRYSRTADRPIFCELSIRETALATLIHQRRLTPSCGGHAPTAERTVGPAGMIAESLKPKPGIREQYRPRLGLADQALLGKSSCHALLWVTVWSDKNRQIDYCVLLCCGRNQERNHKGLTALRIEFVQNGCKMGVLGEKKSSCWEPALDRDCPESGFGKTVCEWYRR